MRDYQKSESTGSVAPSMSLSSLVQMYEEHLGYSAELLNRLQTITNRVVGDDKVLQKELEEMNLSFNQPSPKDSAYSLISHLNRLTMAGSYNNRILQLLVDKLSESI